MITGRLLAVLVIALPLLGCGIIQSIEGKAAFSVGAVPLNFTDPTDPNNVNRQWAVFRESMTNSIGQTTTPRKDYLGFVASASEARCADFLTSLVVASNGTHTGLDMLTTVFSALGTAFSPIATVHAMAAAASISSGWRANIDSDIYARLAIQDMLQAIQATYYTQMASYVSNLPYLNETDIIVPAELTKIQTIHATCTLASARGSVSSSLKPPSQAPSGPTDTATLTISVSGNAAAAGDTIVLTVQSSTVQNIPPVPISINVSKGNNASDIASRMVNTVNNLNLSGVSAKIASTSATSATVNLISQASDKVRWSSVQRNAGNSKVIIAFPPAPAQPTAGTSPGQPGAAVAPAK
jgi:hypothetical protein